MRYVLQQVHNVFHFYYFIIYYIKIEWIIHSIYEVKRFHSSSEFHSILNSNRVKIYYSTSGISSGSLDIHSKRSDPWRQYPWSENWVKIRSIFREYSRAIILKTGIER